jgi:5'-nucleotidase/UDP-sugar diphosphatase
VRRFILALVLAWILQALPVSTQFPVQDPHPRGASGLTVLQINDVYSTVPIDGLGGLARVATIKQELIAAGRTPLLMLAGDFLSSSVASTVFKGEQMIAALNAVPLDVATLGNHEFDFGMETLLQRMSEARWQWVVSNVTDRVSGLPIGGAAPYLVKTIGRLRVGIIGLCITGEGMPRDRLEGVDLIEPLEAAAKYVPLLKAEQVDVIIALTHLSYDQDRALAERFPDIDLIVGGHEHFPVAASVGRTFISKAGSEARYVARVDLSRRAGGEIERFYELMPVTRAIKEHTAAAAVINAWEARLDTAMRAAIGRSRVSLDGVNTHVRTAETNLGNLVADAMREDVKADIALMNGGSIRSDKVYVPGTLTRRTLLEIHPFGNIVCKIVVPGRIVLAALNNGVAKLPAAAGQFPQVSGLTFRIDVSAPPGDRVRDVKVQGVSIDNDRMYTLALPDYILQGGDGYSMFAGQQVLVDAESGRPLVTVLEEYITARRAIAPAIERRITR